MMLALSLLPLLKSTHAAMSASLGGLGWSLLLCWRPRLAVLLAAVFVGALVGFWLEAGQPLWALPGFFLAQLPIVSGYGEAMSLTGAPVDLIRYGINAGLILLGGLLFFARGAGLSRRYAWDSHSRCSSSLRQPSSARIRTSQQTSSSWHLFSLQHVFHILPQ
jgi:hypothetical protein